MAAALLKGVSRADIWKAEKAQSFEECRARLTYEIDQAAASLTIDKRALDYLFSKSRTGLSRRQWESSIRTASATQVATRVLRHSLNWAALMDAEAADQAFTKLSADMSDRKGMLLLTYHGANVIPAQQFLKKRFEGVALLRPKQLEIGDQKKFNDARDVTFGAMRLLQEGGMVLVAPDGPSGRRLDLEIFGGGISVGYGAAFLAHASGSNTAWYTAVRRDDHFAPLVELGPTPRSGESLTSFSDRLNKFYANKLEESFSADPRNIALASPWSKRFLSILDGSPSLAVCHGRSRLLASDSNQYRWRNVAMLWKRSLFH